MPSMLYHSIGSVSTTATISTRPKKRRRLFVAATSESQPDIRMGSTSRSEIPIALGTNHPLTRPTTPPALPVNRVLESMKLTPSSHKASSGSDFASGAPISTVSHDDIIAFDDEFRGYHRCRTDLTIDDFLAEYVLCQDDLLEPPPIDITDLFVALTQPASEDAMYDPLVSGMRKLVEAFPPEYQLHFEKTDGTRFVPAVNSFHVTFPDICSAFPGASDNPICAWDQVAIVCEVKCKQSQDPIDKEGNCKSAFEHQRTRVQLLKNALNMLKQHKSCFVFVIGIYGPTFRIFRFDRSGVVSSVPVNYVSSPQTLYQFLWRLVHPRKAIFGTVSGWDPTIERVTDEDFERMFGLLLKFTPELESQREDIRKQAFWMIACAMRKESSNTSSIGVYNGESVVIPSGHRLAKVPFARDPNQGIIVKCFAFETLFSSNGLFSRASAVYKVIIDHDEFRKQIYVLKDSWQERTRVDEGYYYERIEKHLQDPRIQKKIQDELGDLLPESHVSGLTDYVGTYNLSLYDGDGEKYGLVTRAGRLKLVAGKTCDPSDFDRDRIRTLTGCVGQNLTTFECTKQLVTALRDVVIGLAIASYCGVIHRDVSVGNVLLHQYKPGGFLHDFDYSSVCISIADPNPELFKEHIDRELKDKTGTWPFMAIGILNKGKESHCLRHDLESVYWVLIWCLLRHANHAHEEGKHAAKWLFDDALPEHRRGVKVAWIVTETLPIPGNTALTDLLEDLRILVESNLKAPKSNKLAMELTPRKMLEAMNKALSRTDLNWPSDDASIPYETPLSMTAQAQKAIQQENRENRRTSKALRSAPQLGAGSRNPGRRSKLALSERDERSPSTPSLPTPPPNFSSNKRKRPTHPRSSNKTGRTFNSSPLSMHEEAEGEIE